MSARSALPGSDFWHEAFAMQGAVAVRLLPRMLVFALAAVASVVVHQRAPLTALRPEPVEASAVVLGLLLVFRTAAGYARWWEGRTLWGGIVNQSRNQTMSAVAYGPADAAWRQAVTRWVAVFAHVTRRSLRAERTPPEVVTLVGALDAAAVARAEHMPNRRGAPGSVRDHEPQPSAPRRDLRYDRAQRAGGRRWCDDGARALGSAGRNAGRTAEPWAWGARARWARGGSRAARDRVVDRSRPHRAPPSPPRSARTFSSTASPFTARGNPA